MSFKEFEQAIVSPGLKRVANHWNEARDANRMPSWKAIQPKAIAAQLPLVWVYDYNRAAKQFTGRLSGDQIDRMFGKNLKGVPMSDLYPAADRQHGRGGELVFGVTPTGEMKPRAFAASHGGLQLRGGV